jgi:hypothetical protein
MTKRLVLILALAFAVALALPTIASANFAIHGNYVTDDDACAGCHRAHTSVSSITWEDTNARQHSALLVSTATEMSDFCFACHDATSQGADTNVEQGIYEGTLYGEQDGDLNGGGAVEFQGQPVTSRHMYDSATWGAYGGGYFGQGAVGADGEDPNANIGETAQILMNCATCHDPHGSSNYRILKSNVFGNKVGGYEPNPSDTTDPNPNGWVSSVETGWPAGGFRLHPDPSSPQITQYQPDYTTAKYAKGYDMLEVAGGTALADAENPDKGMSGWCAGCHSTYLLEVGTVTRSDSTTYAAAASVYNAGDGFGLNMRHKHPINVELDTYNAADKSSMIVTDQVLPLAHSLDESATLGGKDNEKEDWIECLTCHRAHGTAATMEGWADELAEDDTDEVPSFISPGELLESGDRDPSNLLRLDNRGVCEVCHNK